MASWADYTTNLQNQGFSGAAIIDRTTYQVLAQFGDAIPRSYDVEGENINENNYLAADWQKMEFSSARYNQIKYMILRSSGRAGEPEEAAYADGFQPQWALGKKGGNGLFLYKLKTIFLIAVSDADKLSMEDANKRVGIMYDSLKTAGC
eukprot:GABV01010217.1.p1 GENE.GABV01010217.1~~GABV01010217.1.p1  ORF type:complete len:149 (-),score=56.26 GABV01010217.1:48-494(-)